MPRERLRFGTLEPTSSKGEAPMNLRALLLSAPFVLALPWSAPAHEAPPTPTPAPTPAPNIDLRMLRFKLSAGDLPSAESILEYHRSETGEDGDYVLGVAWLARGAALVGDWKAASRWAAASRRIAEGKLTTRESWEREKEAVYALGTAIEVEAQALAAAGKKAEAIRHLEASLARLESAGAPYNLRARAWKRRNMLELSGHAAPEIRAEERLGPAFTSLSALRGKPAVLFFWWEACGDCRMQAATLRRVVEKYSSRGVAFVAPTRYYREAAERTEEKGRIEKAWAETYGLTDRVAVPISDSAMLRYGVSATPTFVLLDRGGTVRLYSPTRMSEERLSAEIEKLLR
jgi:thiol-disulfide isomerase/thioredoxin